MTGCCEVATALDDEARAADLAAILVSERLAACAQISGPIRSTYRWKGTIENAGEWRVVFKTAEGRLPEVIARIRALHPYETPEIVATLITGGDNEYLTWIRHETAP